ncbi:UNVERIFIED_CONTAM: hypothetical protein GTU68_000044, partial [Idotea baltica]|nr:hypothetical protein [Idotea baltica]
FRVPGNAGANTLHLAEALNLEGKITPVSSDHISAKNRLIKVNGKLHKLPNSLRSTFSKLPPFSKPLILHLLNDLKAPSVLSSDESFFSFAQRRFGTEVAKYAIDPLCRGVFAGNAKDLSVMALAKRVYALEQEYSSVIKGFILDSKYAEKEDASLKSSLSERAKRQKWSIWSLEGGLESLVRAMEERVNNGNVEILKETNIRQIECKGDKVELVTDKKTYTVDKAISCLPANVLSNLVKGWNADLHFLLKSIPFVSVGLVNLEYPGDIIKEPGFGYLVPSSEPSKVLGVIYDTCTFPHEGKTVLTVMMGGYWFKEFFQDDPSPESFLEIAKDEIRTTFNTSVEPTDFKVSILKDCIPQYTVGHFERVSNIKKLLAGTPLHVAGNSYEGVGVNDVIYNTKKVIQSLL